MEDNVLYYKQKTKSGKVKYIPLKVLCEPESLYTGLYYINVNDNRSVRKATNCQYLGEIYRVGSPKVIDLEEICGLENIVDKIVHHPDFDKICKCPRSTYEFVEGIVAILNNLKIKKNE